jgi:hypothetical protein
MFLDIIHRPVYLKTRTVYFSKHNVSETGFYLRLQEIGTSSTDWGQLSRFYLKTETDSGLRIAVFLDKDWALDNICMNVSVWVVYPRNLSRSEASCGLS